MFGSRVDKCNESKDARSICTAPRQKASSASNKLAVCRGNVSNYAGNVEARSAAIIISRKPDLTRTTHS